MIKLMLHLVKVIVTAFIALFFTSCKYDINLGKNIEGSGNVTKQTRNVSNFDKIILKDGLDCEVIQADKISVIVEADDNLQEGIKTTVENGTLTIESIYNNYQDVTSKKAIVSLPFITDITTSSGSHLFTKDIIKSNEINLKSSSGSEIDVHVESEKVTCESSSGSSIEIEGKAVYLETQSSSGSTINAKKLYTNEAIAKTSSGSSTTVNPILSLNADASSGSTIKYIRKPKTMTLKENSGGSIHE
jgi:hypothetical protein